MTRTYGKCEWTLPLFRGVECVLTLNLSAKLDLHLLPNIWHRAISRLNNFLHNASVFRDVYDLNVLRLHGS